jgi:hypothetical protein
MKLAGIFSSLAVGPTAIELLLFNQQPHGQGVLARQ